MIISKKVFIMLPILCGAQVATQAQNLYVRQHNGIQNAYVINDVKSIKFAQGNVYVHKTSGIDSYALNTVRYMNFTDLMVGINEQSKANNLSFSLFPNPTDNQLNISFSKNIEENGVVTLYTIDGKVAVRQLIRQGNNTFQFNIGNLNAGTYFCNIYLGNQSNTQKFIKH